MYKTQGKERMKVKWRKEGWVVGRKGKYETKKEFELISILLYFTDYAEELRFYLIHMTEVRAKIVCV